jgi:protein PhnA
MARKRPKQRPQVGALGKHLTRRSRGRCELCEAQIDVRPYELPPFPEEPDPERTLMACGRCRDWLERGEVDPIQAHFLSSAVWAELPPVRLAAARLLLACDDLSDPWLQDALDAANVDPATGEFAVPEA